MNFPAIVCAAEAASASEKDQKDAPVRLMNRGVVMEQAHVPAGRVCATWPSGTPGVTPEKATGLGNLLAGHLRSEQKGGGVQRQK